MAITTKLELRQSHSLVMTPQLQQAIKLLNFPTWKAGDLVRAELERNPLLERAEPDETPTVAGEPPSSRLRPPSRRRGSGLWHKRLGREPPCGRRGGAGRRRRMGGALRQARAQRRLDADRKMSFPMPTAFPRCAQGLRLGDARPRVALGIDEDSNLEAYVAEERTFATILPSSWRLPSRSAETADRPPPHRHDRRGRLFARRTNRTRRSPRRPARTSSRRRFV